MLDPSKFIWNLSSLKRHRHFCCFVPIEIKKITDRGKEKGRDYFGRPLLLPVPSSRIKISQYFSLQGLFSLQHNPSSWSCLFPLRGGRNREAMPPPMVDIPATNCDRPPSIFFHGGTTKRFCTGGLILNRWTQKIIKHGYWVCQ